jgi:hypothetical protein
MASTKNKQSLSDMVFDVKEKLTDEEYKNIMDKIADVLYIKIKYRKIQATMRNCNCGECEDEPMLKTGYGTMILKVVKEDDHDPTRYTFFELCEINHNHYNVWKTYQDKKFHNYIELDDDLIVIVEKFEEL